MLLGDPHLYARVCQHLSRRDIVLWSRCCSETHEVLRDLCHLRLSSLQAELVEKLLALDGVDFHRRRQRGFATYGPAYTVGSGTCTGKTVVMLYFAAKLLARGDSPLLLVGTRFLQHIKHEHAKFQQTLELPPLVIAHSYTQPDWRERWTPNCLTLAPMSVAAASQPQRGDPPPKKHTVVADRLALLEHNWDVCIVDEGQHMPGFVGQLSDRNAAFFAVNFNANLASESATWAQDTELGAFPDVTVEYHWNDTLEHDWNDARMPAWSDAWRDYMDARLGECRGRKTIVLTDDTWWAQPRKRGKSVGPHENVSALRLWRPHGTTHSFDANAGSVKKQKEIAAFARASEGLLYAPQQYVARGFNLHCDTLVCFNLTQPRDAPMLLQLLGRVRRIDAPTKLVRMHCFSSLFRPQHIWYRAVPRPLFDYKFIAFAAAFALTSTDSVTRLTSEARQYEGEPRMRYRYANTQGARRRPIAEFGEWIGTTHPELLPHICYISERCAVLTSNPELALLPAE